MERTVPIAVPAKATNGRDFDPTSSSCRMNSRHSYGGVTAAFRTCQEKSPRLPNHSKIPFNNPMPALDGVGSARRSGSTGFAVVAAVVARLLTDSDQALAPHVGLDALSIENGASLVTADDRDSKPRWCSAEGAWVASSTADCRSRRTPSYPSGRRRVG